MVVPLNTVANIVLKGLEIFSDERRRHLSKEYLSKLQALDDAKNARYPDYSDAKIALARRDRDNFLDAYFTEFSARVDELRINKGGVKDV